MTLIFVFPCVPYFIRNDHLYLPVAGLDICSCFFMVEKYCIVCKYPIICFNCASTISLIPSLGHCTLWGQNNRVTHLFFFSILAVFSTPPQSKHETQVCSGSRDAIAAQIWDMAGSKLDIDFLIFVFFNLMLKPCQSTVDLQFCACC